MKNLLTTLCLIIFAATLAGCSARSKIPLTAAGQKVRIQVLCDRGDAATMGSRQFQYRQEVGAFMEPDLVKRFNQAGYDASLIHSREEFKPTPDSYLLTVKIASYNPGSSAARIVVGFGAGAASLNNEYQLFGTAPQPLLEWKDGCGTSEHWSRLPRKLNANTVQKVTEKLQGAAGSAPR